MLDDVREWISDNLRYILLGLAIIVVLIICVGVIRLITGGRSSSGSGTTSDTPAAASATAASGQTEATTQEADEDEPAASATSSVTSQLTKDDAAILTLIREYYTASASGDTTTLSEVVDPWTDEIQNNILNKSVIESYSNLTTYSTEGQTEGSYVVFACYDGKIANIDTLVPSLSVFYVTTNEEGNLVIDADYDSDPDIVKYVEQVKTSSDVQQLVSDTNSRYDAALASDADLAAYINTLDTGSASEDEEVTEAAEGTTMTATVGLNIRQQPTTDSSIVGTVYAGAEVTVYEETGDGWVHISFNSVEGYVMLQYLSGGDSASE